ncbi:MAG: hypothetical protein QNI99_02135 [Woeseiaceae bacterium]|nr:hypothetical protein [Woeseiaceae bacterium]
MIRLLGAITGSALALATLLVFVGVPQFKFESTEAADVEQSVVTLPLPTQPVETLVETADREISEPADPPPALIEEPIPEPVVSMESAVETDIAPEFGAPEYVPDPFDTQTAPADVEPIEPDTLNWYAFWSPFRSEIAATGFVDQLERVTGLDYRVVKIKPGVYEVAFAYSDDTEIAGNLSRITAATGLEMPEG